MKLKDILGKHNNISSMQSSAMTTPPARPIRTFSQSKCRANRCVSKHRSPSPSPDIFPSGALLCHGRAGGERAPIPSSTTAASREDQGGGNRRRGRGGGGSQGGAGIDGGTGLKLDLLTSKLTHVHRPTQEEEGSVEYMDFSWGLIMLECSCMEVEFETCDHRSAPQKNCLGQHSPEVRMCHCTTSFVESPKQALCT